MILAERTWPEVDALSRDAVVLIPTGSIEQHGPHLPFGTDTYLATAAGQAIEAALPTETLLTPCLWLGASLHHMAFPGSLSASFAGYDAALSSVITSLARPGFYRFMVINGHGGNCDSNRITLRQLKFEQPNLQLVAANYFDFIDPQVLAESMRGPHKGIRHACEAETSMMMHQHPELVRNNLIRDDGLEPTPKIPGLITQFDEITEQGSLGWATFATAEAGEKLWQSAVQGGIVAVRALLDGYQFVGASDLKSS